MAEHGKTPGDPTKFSIAVNTYLERLRSYLDPQVSGRALLKAHLERKAEYWELYTALLEEQSELLPLVEAHLGFRDIYPGSVGFKYFYNNDEGEELTALAEAPDKLSTVILKNFLRNYGAGWPMKIGN